MDRRTHVAVAACACDIEEAHALHEKRTLLREENRKPLIHFDLKRAAFNLAEVRIDRTVEGDVRGDAELAAQAEVRFAVGRVPAIRRRARLVHAVRDARQGFDESLLRQMVERKPRVPVEHPLARRQ